MNFTLIYLNPFSQKYLEHMRFSFGKDMDFNAIKKERMEKARLKLDELSFFKNNMF
jgi:hypothetical protein